MNKTLFIAWRSGEEIKPRWGIIGKLDFDGVLYRFCYTQGAKSLQGFQPLPEMDNLEQVYESHVLFPLFANRLMSHSRPEYNAYLRWSGFDISQNVPGPLEILAVTEGIRKTDQFEVFVKPSKSDDGRFQTNFFLHGLRFFYDNKVQLINQLRNGTYLELRPDNHNSSDPNAVGVFFEQAKIGYLPRYLARDIRSLLSILNDIKLTCFVKTKNEEAPLQNRFLCTFSLPWPNEFNPCSSEEYHEIVPHYEHQMPAIIA